MSPTQFQPDHHHDHHHLVKREPMAVIPDINNNNNNTNNPTNNSNNNNTNNSINNNNNNNGSYKGVCHNPLLKMHTESHVIKKSSLSSPTSSSSSGSVSSLAGLGPKPHQQRGPVIIYTHSPKVIHTHPKDFMALVQKLTGMSRSEVSNRDVDPAGSKKALERGSYMPNKDYYPGIHSDHKAMVKITPSGNNNHNNSSNNNDDNESSSVITDENCSSGNTGEVGVGQLNVGPPLFDPPPAAPPPNPLFPSLPFYNMASSSDLLCCGADPTLYDHMDFNLPYNNNHIS